LSSNKYLNQFHFLSLKDGGTKSDLEQFPAAGSALQPKNLSLLFLSGDEAQEF